MTTPQSTTSPTTLPTTSPPTALTTPRTTSLSNPLTKPLPLPNQPLQPSTRPTHQLTRPVPTCPSQMAAPKQPSAAPVSAPLLAPVVKVVEQIKMIKSETKPSVKPKEAPQSPVEAQTEEHRSPTELDDVLFNLLADDDGKLYVNRFWHTISATGLRMDDLRLAETRENFRYLEETTGLAPNQLKVDRDTFKQVMAPLTRSMEAGQYGQLKVEKDVFKKCCNENIVIIGQAFKNDLVIPEFKVFTEQLQIIYNKCKLNTRGKPADYIPQLARVNPKYWGLSICTVDGQRHSFGDTEIPFCLQSTSKALNYAMAVSDLGPRQVHKYVGQEPSGRGFNEITLDSSNKPHNPMINAGAIVTASLIKPGLPIADKFDFAQNQYKRMAGGEFIGFSNSTYLSERETADRNFALAYYMRESDCFPAGTDLTKNLEFYFQLCSVEVTADSASVIAATLANGGICPTTGERVVSGDAVCNTLSLMHSCGMYDYSGQFAFKVGLPAKSGVSGAILLVIPNVMGICAWSPPLDEMGNSCRGVQFCEELVAMFNFHNYDNLKHTAVKLDPRKRQIDTQANAVVNLLFGAASGDVTAIRRFAMLGMDLGCADYDGRTALHLAAAEGQLSVVKVLLEQVGVPLEPHDRWNFTPLDDAKKFKQSKVISFLDDFKKKVQSGKVPNSLT